MNDVRQRDAFDESASIYHSARPRYPAAANSWHWLDRDTRWSKAADLLDDGGHLAIFGASHAFPETSIRSSPRSSVYDERDLGLAATAPTRR